MGNVVTLVLVWSLGALRRWGLAVLVFVGVGCGDDLVPEPAIVELAVACRAESELWCQVWADAVYDDANHPAVAGCVTWSERDCSDRPTAEALVPAEQHEACLDSITANAGDRIAANTVPTVCGWSEPEVAR